MERLTVKYNNGVKIVELELIPTKLAVSDPCAECYVRYDCQMNKDVPSCSDKDKDCLYDGFWKLKER